MKSSEGKLDASNSGEITKKQVSDLVGLDQLIGRDRKGMEKKWKHRKGKKMRRS